MTSETSSVRELPGRKAEELPTVVLTLWQPLASFLAYGLQRIEGRGWSTEFRGPLWIHAASKEPPPDELRKWEEIYRQVHCMDGNVDFQLPEQYPTSALVGLVEVVDVIPAKELAAWQLPPGVRHEGRCHGSGSLFLVEKHKRLVVPRKMSGQHKLWRLERRVAQDALRCLVDSEQKPLVRFSEPCLLASMPRAQVDAEGDSDDDVDQYLLELGMQRSLADGCEAVERVAEVVPQRSTSPGTEGVAEEGSERPVSGAEGCERRRGRWRK